MVRISSSTVHSSRSATAASATSSVAEIEKAAERLAQAPPAEKDKALVELNKLTDALKDRQKQLGTAEQIGRQLQQLQKMTSDGPADDFAKELAKGDFQKAADGLKQLQEKVAADSVIVLQSERGSPLDDASELHEWERRQYGRNVLLLWQREGPAAES